MIKNGQNLFGIDNAVYSVDQMKEILKDREPTVDVDPSIFVHQFPEHNIDHDHSMEVSLDEPLILAEKGSGVILADGWHRAYNSHVTDAGNLPAFVLTESELESTKVD